MTPEPYSPKPYSKDEMLTPDERAVEATLPDPPHAAADERPLVRYRIPPEARRMFARGPWENLATLVIAVGVVMLMQPLSFFLYGWSFAVILTGTVGFVVASHLPE
ncbi:hypothetical protein [Acuticoccus mangrovi]|uniref:Uncharacterized protein n=1 Tax=Acuticoccus mangrovi TaxID=2796142 RepID=A0A934IDG7_9HYPH|nr:hypothetical protein [Acuticoccus mangrovi]MBJ3774528.1 hypothetical protein [Acuticoccus mangrovi]